MRNTGIAIDPMLFACPTCKARPPWSCSGDDPTNPDPVEVHQSRINVAVASIMNAVEAWKANSR